LQQLTHLSFTDVTWASIHYANPPATAFSALTASRKLQHLSLYGCTMLQGLWQHIFPTGKQLPRLRELNIAFVEYTCGSAAMAAGSHLVSCCPSLQHFDMQFLHHRVELLSALSRLTGLHTLCLLVDFDDADEALGAVCQLTGLRQLDLASPSMEEALPLLQLTQLQQLTRLEYDGPREVCGDPLCFEMKVGGGMEGRIKSCSWCAFCGEYQELVPVGPANIVQ
jgi:hypothetical protein